MSGEAGSIGTLTACGEPHPIGLDPLDPGFRRRLDRDALTGRGMGALAERTGDASIAQTAISQIELALTAMRDGGHAPATARYTAQLAKARALLDQFEQALTASRAGQT